LGWGTARNSYPVGSPPTKGKKIYISREKKMRSFGGPPNLGRAIAVFTPPELRCLCSPCHHGKKAISGGERNLVGIGLKQQFDFHCPPGGSLAYGRVAPATNRREPVGADSEKLPVLLIYLYQSVLSFPGYSPLSKGFSTGETSGPSINRTTVMKALEKKVVGSLPGKKPVQNLLRRQ